MTPEPLTYRYQQQLAAQRWAKSQAVRFPGIVFSAIVAGQIFSYEANKRGHWQPLESNMNAVEFHCHAGRDGDCSWFHCPQIRDGEPFLTGRDCPLWDISREKEA